jgi:hypothetical protein
MAALGAVAFDFTMGRERRLHVASILGQIPKFGIVLVLVVVLVLGALGSVTANREETDVLQLICSVRNDRDSRGRGRLLKFGI